MWIPRYPLKQRPRNEPLNLNYLEPGPAGFLEQVKLGLYSNASENPKEFEVGLG